MTERRRRHAAAASRVVTAGLSTATALALVTGMAIDDPADANAGTPDVVAAAGASVDTAVGPGPVMPIQRRIVVVVPRDQLPSSSVGRAVPAPTVPDPSDQQTPTPVTQTSGS